MHGNVRGRKQSRVYEIYVMDFKRELEIMKSVKAIFFSNKVVFTLEYYLIFVLTFCKNI